MLVNQLRPPSHFCLFPLALSALGSSSVVRENLVPTEEVCRGWKGRRIWPLGSMKYCKNAKK